MDVTVATLAAVRCGEIDRRCGHHEKAENGR
jgi:hypothetical protein